MKRKIQKRPKNSVILKQSKKKEKLKNFSFFVDSKRFDSQYLRFINVWNNSILSINYDRYLTAHWKTMFFYYHSFVPFCHQRK